MRGRSSSDEELKHQYCRHVVYPKKDCSNQVDLVCGVMRELNLDPCKGPCYMLRNSVLVYGTLVREYLEGEEQVRTQDASFWAE